MGLITALDRRGWYYTGARTDYHTYFTRPDQFYHVDHGGIPAPIAPESWTLEISGLVKSPRTFTYAELNDRVADRGITRYVKCLQCLRDPLGDDVERRWYASSGLWGGLPLADLLNEVGVLPGATRIDYGGRDPSGFFASIPVAHAMAPRQGLPVLLTTELNMQPLPHIRGGPVRMLIPDLLGFKSIKWVSWLCLTDARVPNGWYERGRGVTLPACCEDPPLKTMARIASVPGSCGPTHPRLSVFPAGQPLMFRGYAVAGPRGLVGVRYQVRKGMLHGPICHAGQAAFEAPGQWGLPGPLPEGIVHFQGDRPVYWPPPSSWVFWQACFGPLPRGKYHFEVWAQDAQGHEQPMPDPDRHSGSANRENVVFHVG